MEGITGIGKCEVTVDLYRDISTGWLGWKPFTYVLRSGWVLRKREKAEGIEETKTIQS